VGLWQGYKYQGNLRRFIKIHCAVRLLSKSKAAEREVPLHPVLGNCWTKTAIQVRHQNLTWIAC
jgi:hypothetical protein